MISAVMVKKKNEKLSCLFPLCNNCVDAVTIVVFCCYPTVMGGALIDSLIGIAWILEWLDWIDGG